MTGLCDAHVHVVDAVDRRPMVSPRPYTPPPARLADLAARARPLGIDRFVVVQPSFYGTDNRVTVEALRDLGGRGRGVAVIDPAAIDDAALDDLARTGVRGLRINLYSPGSGTLGTGLEERFVALSEVARRMGWHVEVLASATILLAAADLLAQAPVPVVIDHYGLVAGTGPTSPEGARLIGLARRGHVWVKLSAPYRSTGDALGIVPDRAWLAAFLEAAPERCVWGSDWPHTPAHEAQPGDGAVVAYRPLDYAALVAAFRDALPEAGVAEAVLGTNPARLYGFDP